MRRFLVSGALLLLGTATASAQYWDGPRYDDRPPPPRARYWDEAPPRHYGPPPPRCWWRETPWGPRRVCREW